MAAGGVGEHVRLARSPRQRARSSRGSGCGRRCRRRPPRAARRPSGRRRGSRSATRRVLHRPARSAATSARCPRRSSAASRRPFQAITKRPCGDHDAALHAPSRRRLPSGSTIQTTPAEDTSSRPPEGGRSARGAPSVGSSRAQADRGPDPVGDRLAGRAERGGEHEATAATASHGARLRRGRWRAAAARTRRRAAAARARGRRPRPGAVTSRRRLRLHRAAPRAGRAPAAGAS